MQNVIAGLEPVYREVFGAAALRDVHPPRFRLPHKRALFDLACEGGPQRGGPIEVSRWPTVEPPAEGRADSKTIIEPRPGAFEYAPPAPGAIEWHANFAAGDLFEFYEDRCFAQDEIQVMEHPALGGVREGLIARGRSTRVTDRGRPTPILITGVERRLSIDTDPNAERGRPNGLYGRNFAAAPVEAALGATTVIDPPTLSNIVVFEAPKYGRGRYDAGDIFFALLAAHTAFSAAIAETRRLDPSASCVIHTGFWGSGAYGGNHVLMTAVQLLAARLAGLDRLHFFMWDEPGVRRFERGREVTDRIAAAHPRLAPESVIEALVEEGFAWGVSDGN